MKGCILCEVADTLFLIKGDLAYAIITLGIARRISNSTFFNSSEPEFTIVIFKMIRCVLKIKENCHVVANQFHGNFRSKTLSCWKIRSVFRDVK